MAAAAALALTACQPATDFSRRAPTALPSPPLPVPVVATPAGPQPLALTDLEHELRGRAEALLVPTSPFAAALPPAAADITLYGAKLSATPYASATARFARLHDDADDDRLRLEPFLTVAAKVDKRDAIRRAAAGYIAASPSEQEAMHARMADNAVVTAHVLAVLQARAAAYRYALEHLVLATPSPAAVAAERAVMQLEADLREADSPTMN